MNKFKCDYLQYLNIIFLTIFINSRHTDVHYTQYLWVMSGFFSGFSRFPNFVPPTLFTVISPNSISFIISMTVFSKKYGLVATVDHCPYQWYVCNRRTLTIDLESSVVTLSKAKPWDTDTRKELYNWAAAKGAIMTIRTHD